MLIGYARVSTNDQTLDLQLDALKKAGCTRIFQDKVSGMKAERPGLQDAMSHLREGDTLLVWRLDRLGRNLKHLIDTVNELDGKGVSFVSLNERIETGSANGKLLFGIFGALAQFERDLMAERTRAGLAAARARGRNGGRPSALKNKDPKLVEQAWTLYQNQQASVTALCKMLGLKSRATFYSAVVAPRKGK